MPTQTRIPRIDALTAPPIVGERYLVPTVTHPWREVTSAWPVMGPKHEDVDLHFPWPHYHVDLRFLTVRQGRKMIAEYGDAAERHGLDAVTLAAASAPVHMTRETPPLPDPVWRPRVCISTDHRYPLGYALRNTPHVYLHRTYAGRRCGRDAGGQLICPHKGFALGTLRPDAGGRVTCPLHGLIIDVATATVVAPPEPEPRPEPRSEFQDWAEAHSRGHDPTG